MTFTPSRSLDVENLRRSLRGVVFTPEHPEYDQARRVWNGNIDKRPAVIVRCAEAEDVAVALAFGRSHELPIAIRGGGHSAAGFSTCNDGIVLDMSPMRSIEIDPEAQTASVQAGTTWHELDMATAEHDLVVTGGRMSQTGVAGLTLGGGIGHVVRSFGLTCDSLIGADLVTADGRFVHASQQENAELLWALRGGGGNFGVVTRFEFRLHQMERNIIAGLFTFRPEQGAEILKGWADFSEALPDGLTGIIYLHRTPTSSPYIPDEHLNQEAYIATICSVLSFEETRRLVQPLVELKPFFHNVGPVPYVLLQSIGDDSYPAGSRAYPRGRRLRAIDQSAADVVAEYCLRRPKTGSRMYIEHMGGAISRVPEDGSAFPDRTSPFSIQILGYGKEDAQVERSKAWARAFWEELRPYDSGAYLNWLGPDEEPDRVARTFGPDKYRRLAQVKAEWDPHNVFRLNANIKPAG